MKPLDLDGAEEIAPILKRSGLRGPDPLGAYLVLRKQRRRVGNRKKDLVEDGTWYIKDGRKRISSRCRKAEHNKAKLVLAAYKRRKVVEELIQIDSVGTITFKNIITERSEKMRNLAKSPDELRACDRHENLCVHLLCFFGNKKIIEYQQGDSEEFVISYKNERTEKYYKDHPEDKRDPRTTARMALKHLKRLCREFVQAHEIDWCPDIAIPRRRKRKKALRWLSRDELARLLWACRGRQWDRNANGGKGGWRTKTYIDADGNVRTTRIIARSHIIEARRALTRAIRIGYRVGCREEVIRALAWGRYAKLGGFDVDDEGEGWLHRRGYQEEDTNKARPSSEVPALLAWLLRIWKRADGKSKRRSARQIELGAVRPRPIKYVVHKRYGEGFKSPLVLGPVARDAGLGRGIGMHVLKHTAVEYAHEMRVGITAAAAMLGTTKETLLECYTDWERLHECTAKQAYDDREARQRLRAMRVHGAEPDDQIRFYDKPYRPRSRAA
jgi:hypothetical protein